MKKKYRKKPPAKNTVENKQSKNKIPIIVGVIMAGIVGSMIILLASNANIDSDLQTMQIPTPQEIIDDCKDDVHCVVEKIQNVSYGYKKDMVIPLFLDLISKYNTQKTGCHETGHHLGMWLYGYVGDVDESLSYAEQICGGAIFHGVIQNYLMTQNFRGANPDSVDISQICGPTVNPYSIERWQCLHGLGHGLANLYDYDILAAVQRCEEFKPGWEEISCSKGIFMQNVVKYFETKTGDFDEDDLFYPCNTVAEKSMPQCYHYHTTYVLIQNEGLVKPVFDVCDNITPEQFIKFCYYGLGRQLSQNIDRSMEKAVMFCTLGSIADYHSECLRGMLLTVVNGNKDPSIGFVFCSSMPEEYKVNCYDGLGQWILMIADTDVERTLLCIKAESIEYRDICKNADLESIIHL